MSEPLLEIRDLVTEFRTEHGVLRAVDNLSFSIPAGKTLGVVGESGCGKSVTALSVMRLIPDPPGQISKGSIAYHGDDLLKLSEEAMRKIRGNKISMIFQEPMTSLNPVFTVGDQVAEAVRLHQGKSRKEALAVAVEMFQLVGIPSPVERVRNYPHEMSGGMRQRVMIAMAILCKPRVLIVDEPTTALDVTTQAQILDLLKRLQHEHGTSILAVTHDFGVVAVLAHQVAVMYAGRLFETGTSRELFGHPHHPYTFGLLRSAPTHNAPSSEPLPTLPGSPPDMLAVPHGCAFHPRCPFAKERCTRERPPLVPIRSPDASAMRVARMFQVGGRTSACFETERVAALTGLWTTAVDWASPADTGSPQP